MLLSVGFSRLESEEGGLEQWANPRKDRKRRKEGRVHYLENMWNDFIPGDVTVVL